MAFDYKLPDELIARYPLPERTDSRLLIVNPTTPTLIHQSFSQLPDWLHEGDLLVMNNTRVVKARLFGKKMARPPTAVAIQNSQLTLGGKCELLVERVFSDSQALAMIKASKAPKINSQLQIGDQQVSVLAREGQFYQLLLHQGSWWQLMEASGSIPLPPYLRRPSECNDEQRYQSVFAQHRGAVAAPTASLHFSESLLSTLRAKGVQQHFLTLHIGAGTFLPLREDQLITGKLHQERVVVGDELVRQIECTHSRGSRVIAVGTTVVRALESAALSGQLKPLQAETDLFIREGFQFRVVDAIITNFHLPQSSLLMLVCAFAGQNLMQQVYQTAINMRYRFFSYGDAMLITPRTS